MIGPVRKSYVLPGMGAPGPKDGFWSTALHAPPPTAQRHDIGALRSTALMMCAAQASIAARMSATSEAAAAKVGERDDRVGPLQDSVGLLGRPQLMLSLLV
jgi:hypothetical protein